MSLSLLVSNLSSLPAFASLTASSALLLEYEHHWYSHFACFTQKYSIYWISIKFQYIEIRVSREIYGKRKRRVFIKLSFFPEWSCHLQCQQTLGRTIQKNWAWGKGALITSQPFQKNRQDKAVPSFSHSSSDNPWDFHSQCSDKETRKQMLHCRQNLSEVSNMRNFPRSGYSFQNFVNQIRKRETCTFHGFIEVQLSLTARLFAGTINEKEQCQRKASYTACFLGKIICDRIKLLYWVSTGQHLYCMLGNPQACWGTTWLRQKQVNWVQWNLPFILEKTCACSLK